MTMSPSSVSELYENSGNADGNRRGASSAEAPLLRFGHIRRWPALFPTEHRSPQWEFQLLGHRVLDNIPELPLPHCQRTRMMGPAGARSLSHRPVQRIMSGCKGLSTRLLLALGPWSFREHHTYSTESLMRMRRNGHHSAGIRHLRRVVPEAPWPRMEAPSSTSAISRWKCRATVRRAFVVSARC